jgi:ATP-dependent DNA helicase RecQ
VVRQCEAAEHKRLLLAGLRACEGESAIVYAPTIAAVEQTVDFLAEHGVEAVPYHGQMENNLRRRNQERWMNDEARVLVGTIAFGLGINKPAVRAVIHTSLPKSIEQYYQEAGRAGRDGLPADCVLLWQPKDVGLLVFFIDQLNDPAEKQRAWQRYHSVRGFAESSRCRHLQICTHFGQIPKWQRCEMCDVCGNQPAWLTAPLKEERAKKKKRPAVSIEPPPRAETAAPAPRAPVPAPPAPARELMDLFKEWRRTTANRTNVAAFVVLSDAALEDLCRKRPSNLRELLAVSGIGERKAELYGAEIFAVFDAFRKGARAAARQAAQSSPAEETLQLLAEGKSFEEIAGIRGRRLATVVEMVADLVAKGRLEYRIEWVGEENHRIIEEAVRRLGSERLKPLMEALPAHITYEQIRLVIGMLHRNS